MEDIDNEVKNMENVNNKDPTDNVNMENVNINNKEPSGNVNMETDNNKDPTHNVMESVNNKDPTDNVMESVNNKDPTDNVMESVNNKDPTDNVNNMESVNNKDPTDNIADENSSGGSNYDSCHSDHENSPVMDSPQGEEINNEISSPSGNGSVIDIEVLGKENVNNNVVKCMEDSGVHEDMISGSGVDEDGGDGVIVTEPDFHDCEELKADSSNTGGGSVIDSQVDEQVETTNEVEDSSDNNENATCDSNATVGESEDIGTISNAANVEEDNSKTVANSVETSNANSADAGDVSEPPNNASKENTVENSECVESHLKDGDVNVDDGDGDAKKESDDTSEDIEKDYNLTETAECGNSSVDVVKPEDTVSEKPTTTTTAVVMRDKGNTIQGNKDEFKPTEVEFGLEDFGKMQQQAEQRLAARRAAREEARLIRMKELEKQQRDMEEKQDRLYELTKDSTVDSVVIPKIVAARSYQGSRRGSDDSASSEDHRELRKTISELEDKYKKAMMNNASLDNEKQTYRYQVDSIKDQLEELEETCIELQRLLKDRCRELEQKRRDFDDLSIECEYYKQQVQQRDKLIQEYGLVFINNDTGDDKEEKTNSKKRRKKKQEGEEEKAALVTPDAMSILAKVEGNLDEKLRGMAGERERLEGEVKTLRLQLEEEREKSAMAEKYASPKREQAKEVTSNGPLDSLVLDTNMEAQKQLTEYRYKIKKAEQDITVLEGNVIRLESQVKRWKASSDESEKDKEDMKTEKRKLQREMREKQNQIAELESQNENLQKRLEKFRKERMDAIISGKS